MLGDGLVAYRQEASNRFQKRQERVADETVNYLFNASVEVAEPT